MHFATQMVSKCKTIGSASQGQYSYLRLYSYPKSSVFAIQSVYHLLWYQFHHVGRLNHALPPLIRRAKPFGLKYPSVQMGVALSAHYLHIPSLERWKAWKTFRSDFSDHLWSLYFLIRSFSYYLSCDEASHIAKCEQGQIRIHVRIACRSQCHS
jgi:hypothetical protein